MTPPRTGGGMTVDAFMELVDAYAERYMWQAGYEPPKPKAVELTRQHRQAVVDALMEMLDQIVDGPP